MVALEATEFTLPGPPQDGGLTLALTRFRASDRPEVETHGERLSILFIHGISYHKETWIPTVERLFELQSQAINSNFVIAEAWVLDGANHGMAAILNETKLLSKPESIAPYEMARTIETVFKSGLIEGTSLVGIAHSASTPVLTLSTLGYEGDKLPYSRMILVEPPMLTRELYAKVAKKGKVWEIMTEIAKARKDIWPSREAAREWMAKRPPWSAWDPRCLDLFVKHGLRDLPTAVYPDRTDGVTLCCTRDQEAVSYSYGGDEGIAAIDRLEELCKAIPVHVIYGGNADIIPEFVRAAFLKTKQCQNIASVTTIPGAGHLVVEEDPTSLGLAIWGALHGSASKSRL